MCALSAKSMQLMVALHNPDISDRDRRTICKIVMCIEFGKYSGFLR